MISRTLRRALVGPAFFFLLALAACRPAGEPVGTGFSGRFSGQAGPGVWQGRPVTLEFHADGRWTARVGDRIEHEGLYYVADERFLEIRDPHDRHVGIVETGLPEGAIRVTAGGPAARLERAP